MGTGAKVAITVAVVLGAVGYLVYTTVESGEALEYYKHVHEVMDDPSAWSQRKLQLHGNVVQGTIFKRKGRLDFRFALHREGRWIDVVYSGLVPDTFKDCAEVVVKGRLTGEQTFAAKSISAKCPSKYDGKRQRGACGARHTQQVLASRKQQ
jgi:cytochrome c-type biogenesis protein CcmE